jgi:hypothetical protein
MLLLTEPHSPLFVLGPVVQHSGPKGGRFAYPCRFRQLLVLRFDGFQRPVLPAVFSALWGMA